MKLSQSNKLLISPLNNQQPMFPTISYKTSESPSKIVIPLTNYLLFEQQLDQINVNKINKQQKQNRVDTIYKYIRQQVVKKNDNNQEKSKTQTTTVVNESEDKIKKSKEQPSNSYSLKQIQKKQSQQKLQRMSKSYIDLHTSNLCNQIQNQCIFELDQEQEDGEHNLCSISQNQINKSPNLYCNLKSKKNCKLINQSKVVLDFNQQNKKYKDQSFQIIHLISKVQQNLLKQKENDRQQQEREYKLKKCLRQKERLEGMYNAQLGLKNRRLNSLLNALKGTDDKKIENDIVNDIRRKYQIQRSQSTIMTRKSSLQLSNPSYVPDEQFEDKLIRKFSQVSDICSSENSLDQTFPYQIKGYLII
ncbi:unnamed protein product (macronuclear) [Paramecium tetraurelia]|uniref:Uncharacterized protein n=1 Tax=Paramecium tetraurelia TaxID=5888 RepID=A0BCI8_PARTE|nr:uncharacterized protein GSPATT00004349001 [Paramecium tetraurelia]CAK56255.1 unnamed protein product [Paramecium tetraurelia]|eukprot:XP_001423653.1 hypothetical protein (macronuclear) [Paramecium tetraurelia strain d4-2]